MGRRERPALEVAADADESASCLSLRRDWLCTGHLAEGVLRDFLADLYFFDCLRFNAFSFILQLFSSRGYYQSYSQTRINFINSQRSSIDDAM